MKVAKLTANEIITTAKNEEEAELYPSKSQTGTSLCIRLYT